MTFTVRGVRNNERVYPGYIIYDFIFYIVIFICTASFAIF